VLELLQCAEGSPLFLPKTVNGIAVLSTPRNLHPSGKDNNEINVHSLDPTGSHITPGGMIIMFRRKKRKIHFKTLQIERETETENATYRANSELV
jgi:hypothetical protein